MDSRAGIDEGLRRYMLRVYNYMALGIALTGVVAFAVSSSPAALQLIFGTPLKWVVMLAPLAFIMVLSFGLHRLSMPMTQLPFWVFAGSSTATMMALEESLLRALEHRSVLLPIYDEMAPRVSDLS